MENLIKEVEAFANRHNLLPATVVQYATGQGGSTWARWKSGGECTMGTAARVRAYMAEKEAAK